MTISLDHENLQNMLAEFKQGKTNLTQEQLRLWFLLKLDPGMPNKVLIQYEIHSSIDVAVMQQAISYAIDQFEIFNVVFTEVLGNPIRKKSTVRNVNFNFVDLSHEPSFEDSLKVYNKNELEYTFDIQSGPLVRINLHKAEEHKYFLFISASKLVADSITVDLFAKYIFKAYTHTLHNTAIPYNAKQNSIDFFKVEREWLKNPDISQLINTCKEKLNHVPVLQIPEDNQRPAIKNHATASVNATLPVETLKKLQFYSQKHNISLNNILLSIYAILLGRYSSQSHFCIAALIDRRHWLGNKDLLGNIENVASVAVDLNTHKTFQSLTDNLASQLNQDTVQLPFKTLLENLSIERDLSRTPVVQTLFTFEFIQNPVYQTDDLLVNKTFSESGINSFDLTFNVACCNNQLKIRIDYDANLYLPDNMRLFLNVFSSLLDTALIDPSRDIFSLPLLNESDKNSILSHTAQVTMPLSELAVHQFFEAQARKTPLAIAVISDDNKITYQELDEQANRLAHYLQTKDITSQQHIAVFLERSIDTIVAIFAILKAGCAYVPVDVEYPNERIDHMLHDSQVKLVITRSTFLSKIKIANIDKICLDIEETAISKLPCTSVNVTVSPQHVAYLMYTSGSTGKSKAVIINHISVVNHLSWRQQLWPLNINDRILLNSSFSFDPSVWSIFWTLATGAATVITPSHFQNDILALIALMKKQKITLIGTVPSLIALLVDEPEFTACRSLRYLLSGGELLTSSLQEKIYSRTSAKLMNLYGPTEITMDATYFVTSKQTMSRNAPIGKPNANQQVYILDENLQIQPIGVKGEIFVGGIGVARGYFGRPALTAERFLPDPFSKIPGSRLYRTGDLGKLLWDGNIQFCGRQDEQVKIRGYRVELTEVEKVLSRHPAIKEVAVIINQEILNNARMIAYIVPKEHDLTYAEVTSYLAEQLPAYMLPNIIHNLRELPKLPNEKIDRRALLQYKPQVNHSSLEEDQPLNEMQQIVKEFFSEALGAAAIRSNDDFFELGGTSLVLSGLASRLYKHFDIAIPLHQFFKIPTISGVADMITRYHRDGINAVMEQKHIVELSEDAILATDIQPYIAKKGNYTNPAAVFITGVTGYLGAFLLNSLITQNKAKFYCLIRADNHEHAMTRIQNIMELYGIWNETHKSRLVPVLGDLALPAIGLANNEWDNLADKIDIIYHCGALVNFAYPYSALRAANVKGTQEILRLACQGQLKAVHYISTIDVLLATHTQRPFIEDDAPLKYPSDIPGGYTASKWVAEKLMNAAMERGIPVAIYRPGLIMSHTTTGATQTNDYILVAFRGFVPMKIMPDYTRIFDIVPVDYVADAIINISLQENCYGKFYHLFNPAPVSLFQFCEWTKTYGYQFKIVPFEQGKERALQVDSNHPLYPLVPLIRDADPEPQRSLDPRFMDELQYELECKNTLTALKDSNIACPGMSEQLTHLCLQYLINIDFLPAPSTLNNELTMETAC